MIKPNSAIARRRFEEELKNVMENEGLGESDLRDLINEELTYNGGSIQEAFTKVVCDNMYIYYDDMRQSLKVILEESEAQANKFSNDKVRHCLGAWLYMAYNRLFKKINF